jgi:hypothetical protein
MVDRLLPATVWPIGLLLACVVLEASQLRLGIDDLDEGYFVQQATRVLHGQVPFRDFETLYSPGLAYLHAGVFALLGGVPELVAPRVVSLLARAGLGLVLIAMTLPLVRNPLWAAVPALILLVGLDDAPERWEPHPGWLSSLFAVVAVWCLSQRRQQSWRWLVAAGLAAAAAFAFKQNTGVYILAAVLLWCGRNHWKPVLLAFGVASLVWVAPLAIANREQLTRLGPLIGAVNQAGLFSAPEPTLAIPLAAIAGGLWLLRRDSHPDLRWFLLGGGALLLTQVPRMDTLHLVWSTPILLVLGAVALERVPRPVALLCGLAVLALVWPTLSSRLAYVSEPRATVADVEAPTQTAADIQGAVDDIQWRTQAGEPIFVYPTSPLLYALANRPNPTRFDHLNPGAATPAQIQAVIADLQGAGVKLVVISDFWQDAWGAPGANAVLEDWLSTHYTEVGRHGAYRVLEADL